MCIGVFGVTSRQALAGTSVLGPTGEIPRYEAERNLNARLAADVMRTSTPDLLRYEDKNSMAFSIEARVPFLDHELVEHIFSLPIDQKIKNGWNRAVYRNAMRGRMPEQNRLRRSKVGFINPDIAWMHRRRHHGRVGREAMIDTAPGCPHVIAAVQRPHLAARRGRQARIQHARIVWRHHHIAAIGHRRITADFDVLPRGSAISTAENAHTHCQKRIA